MITAITALGTAIIEGVTGYFTRKQKIQEAAAENRARLLATEAEYNHEWEMKQLENSGWKDDILFYSIIALYVWSAYDPQGAQTVFTAWEALPDWFLQITGWMVAAVLGVKKLGDYLPQLISGVRGAIKGK